MKIRTCPFCNKKTSNSPHIYGCKENQNKLSKSEIKYLFLSHNFPDITKKSLYSAYIIEKKSLNDIKSKYDIDLKSICFLLDYFDIRVRTISDATKLTTDKKINTCLQKYGVEWYSQTDKAKLSKKETFKKNYGTDNIWKSDYFKKNLDKYFFKKHGLNRSEYFKDKWIKLNEEEKSKILKDWYSKCTYSSGLEKRIKSILDDMGIEYISNGLINNRSFDIIIDNNIIEIQGDFWHANPDKYKPNDYLNFPGGKKIKASELWKKDEEKKVMVEKLKYNLLYLWENDIKRKTDSELSLILLDFISNN